MEAMQMTLALTALQKNQPVPPPGLPNVRVKPRYERDTKMKNENQRDVNYQNKEKPERCKPPKQ